MTDSPTARPGTDLPSIADLHARLAEATRCAMEITLVHALPEDGEAAFSEYERLYPINAMRNVAVDHARSDLLFLLDVDFVPCRRLGALCKAQLPPRGRGPRSCSLLGLQKYMLS
jgi:hypothetical protein